MPTIELGVDFNIAKEEDDKNRQPLKPGVYTMTCVAVEMGESKKGRPMLIFDLETSSNSDAASNGKKFKSFCPLPHNGDNSGIGFLLNVTKALGKPWVGNQITTEDYIGLQCAANLADGKPNDDGHVFSQIKSFVI